MRLACAAFACLLLAPVAWGAGPSLVRTDPLGAQRGQTVVVHFAGQRLQDAAELMLYDAGIAVQKVAPVNAGQVDVTLTIAPDCRLGEHLVRLRTNSGVSEMRGFWVGALPEVKEVEPNGDFEKPQPIPLNSTVTGRITSEDVDYFQVECKKGQRLSVEVEGIRLGTQFWDPAVAILDSRRFELAANDDSALTGQDPGCSVVIPADGKYIVQLRESSYQGNEGAFYRMHVGTFPRPTAVFPAGGRPGEEVEFRFAGDPAGEVRQKIKLGTPALGFQRLHCQTPEGVHPAGIKVRVVDLPTVQDTPTADDHSRAVLSAVPGAFTGVISKPGERKFVRFSGKKGTTFDATCYARKLGSPLDPVIHLAALGPKGELGGQIIADDDGMGGVDSMFRVTLPQDGDYVLWVRDHLNKGAPDYFFRVELTPSLSASVVGLPKADPNNVGNQDRQAIAVPRGGRAVMLLSLNRVDWSAPAHFAFPNLPAGVTPRHDVLDPSQGVLPVVLEAKADAPLAGALTAVSATPGDDKITAPCRTEVEGCFNLALNNTPFYRTTSDRVAVTVSEPAPYSIEVVEPKSPLPQNGSRYLKVIAKRAPGFKGPIGVYTVYTPPGVGIQGATTIQPEAGEVNIPINAAGNAPLKTWKLALLATADAGQGPVHTSSQLFALTVGPPVSGFSQERAAVEQGRKVPVFCKLDVKLPTGTPATLRLLGLPAKASAPDLPVTGATKELSFDVSTDKSTPAGKHGTFCVLVYTMNGEEITQSLGGAELRVDAPLPPKPAAVAAKPAAPPPSAPAAPQKAPEKRLTRLEQLRLEQEAREKGEKGPGKP